MVVRFIPSVMVQFDGFDVHVCGSIIYKCIVQLEKLFGVKSKFDERLKEFAKVFVSSLYMN